MIPDHIVEKAAKAMQVHDYPDDLPFAYEDSARATLEAVYADIQAEAWGDGFDVGSSHGIAYQAGDNSSLPRPAGLNPYRPYELDGGTK